MTPRRAAVASLAMLVLVVTGCAGQEPTGAPADQGRHTDAGHAGDTDDPGHGSTVHEHAVVAPPPDADWNAADATYLSMMVAHHSQALDLAELAAARAVDPRVRALAETIDVGQGREILVMADWLVDHDQPEPSVESVAAMTSMGMPGMLRETQLDALAAAEGAAFDRQFLEDMIQHHQGAIAMAEDLLGTGEDVLVVEMAAGVVAGQGAEIARMRQLLADLP